MIGGAARNGTIYLDDVNLTSNFGMLRVVSQSCQANDVFAAQLSRRLGAGRPPSALYRQLLGVVETNIRRDFPRWMKWLVSLVFDLRLDQTSMIHG